MRCVCHRVATFELGCLYRTVHKSEHDVSSFRLRMKRHSIIIQKHFTTAFFIHLSHGCLAKNIKTVCQVRSDAQSGIAIRGTNELASSRCFDLQHIRRQANACHPKGGKFSITVSSVIPTEILWAASLQAACLKSCRLRGKRALSGDEAVAQPVLAWSSRTYWLLSAAASLAGCLL